MKLAIFKIGLIILAAYIGSACSNQSIPLEIIYHSNNCAPGGQSLKSINSATELEHLLNSFPKTFSNFPSIEKTIDYQKQSLIFFGLGQKSSAGYSIELKSKVATLSGKNLCLPISIIRPDEDGFQAQVITSPCQIYAIPKTDFTEIEICND